MRETICKGLIFEPLTLKEFLASCNKDYLESSLSNSQKSDFKQKVAQYLESYEQNKGHNESAIVANALAPFLKELGFHAQPAYKQQGNSEIDLSLLKDSKVEIIIEAKKQPINAKEMFSPNKPNCKALHECILYYFREREGDSQTLIPNVNLRFIIITDFTQFYIFSAREFERHFYKNKAISNLYKTHKEKGLIDNSKDFYTEIQKILVKQLNGGGGRREFSRRFCA